jgi:histidinol phosphatase-like enzyme (inositol monophosphatase family)
VADELDELLEIARRAAVIAGEVIMPLYASSLTVELKADRTPVTVADRRAEEEVRAFLERECPAHGILGEELGEKPGDGRSRWILDPIDGTKSFIHHVPLFGTLVALERDGEPVVGVIACHAAGETIYAASGKGAWLNGRRAEVSRTTRLDDATVSATSLARVAKVHPRAFRALVDRTAMMRTWGDCFGYLLVGSGRVDAMLDPAMNLWDVAALAPIIREAGGRLTTWEGEDRLGESAVASNGLLHAELMSVLRTG